MGATCFKEHALPDSTANGITYPVPGDYVKAAEFASKLAKDFETLALTADQAIVAGVAQGIIPVLSGYVKPKPIPSGTDLLTLDTGWWYNRLTSVAGTMLNRPQGVTDGPFMVHMVRTPFGHSTITYYGYSGTAGGLFENHTGNAAHTAWVGWRRLDGTTGGGITQGSGLAGFANILRTQMFRDAMGPVTTGGKGAIAFRFDHGLSKFNSIMRPLLEARGIKYSLALSARNFNAGENAGVTASMVNSWTGAEVWNHGANQHQDESSVAGLTDQIVTGLAELQAALPNKQIWGYAVPGTGGSGQGGFFGGATAEQFYETAAGDLILTNHAVSSGSMSGTSRRPLDGRIRQGMAHFTIEAQTVARIKSEIDNAISNKTGNQLMMHPNLLNTEGYLTTAQLVEVLDYVVAKRDAGDLVVLSPYEMVVGQLSTSGGSGVPGPPGAGVPAGGEALQVIRKNAFNTTTEWATLTKSLVGLSSVDNTSDMNKPVSTMQKLALDEKIDAAKLPDEIDSANKNLIEDEASLTAGALSDGFVDRTLTAFQPPVLQRVTSVNAGSARFIDQFDGRMWASNLATGEITWSTTGETWESWTNSWDVAWGAVSRLLPTSDGEVIAMSFTQLRKSSGWASRGAGVTWSANKLSPNGSSNFNPFGIDGDGTKFLIVQYNSTPATWNESRYGHISLDAGETWALAYDSETLHGSAANAESHLHGACYDPWADVFYIGEGHGSAGGVYYSTDDGATWGGPLNVESNAITKNNAPTVIVATNDGLVMGSDNNENGLFGMLRKPNPADQRIVRTWAMRTGRDGLVTFAQRGWRDPQTGFVYITFRSEYSDTPITLAAGTASSGGLVYEEPTLPVNGGADRFAAVARIDPDTLYMYGEVLGVAKHFKGTLTRPGSSAPELFTDTGQTLHGKVDDPTSVSVGRSQATGVQSTAVGQRAKVTGAGSVAVGFGAVASSSDAVAVGRNSTADNAGTSFGSGAKGGAGGVAVGYMSEVAGAVATAIGNRAKAGIEGVAIGRLAETTGTRSVAIGFTAAASNDSVTIGHLAKAFSNGVAIGMTATLSGNNSVAIGRMAKAGGDSTAIGDLADTGTSTGSVALGKGSVATHNNQVALGARHIYMADLTVDPGMPASGQGLLYFKADGLYFRTIDGIKKVTAV